MSRRYRLRGTYGQCRVGFVEMTRGGFAALAVGREVDARLVEEPHLLAAHADAQRAYRARTGRFVPRVGRVSDR